jgi:hypothetical protein
MFLMKQFFSIRNIDYINYSKNFLRLYKLVPDDVLGAVGLRERVVGPPEDEGVAADLTDDDVAQLGVAVQLPDLLDELNIGKEIKAGCLEWK